VLDNLERVKRVLGAYCNRTKRDIRIAVTSYITHFESIPRLIHGVHRIARREDLGRNKARNRSLGAALYEAMLLNLFIREEAVEIAGRAFLFHGNDSALWNTSAGGICRNPQHEMQALYDRLAGKYLLESEVKVDTFSSIQLGIIPAQTEVPYLDVIAARSDETERFSVYVINRSMRTTITGEMLIKGFTLKRVEVRGIHASDVGAFNTVRNPDAVQRFSHHFVPEITARGSFLYRFPPHSLSVLTLEGKEWF
jgi:alpha-L-arabinofuranosidase